MKPVVSPGHSTMHNASTEEIRQRRALADDLGRLILRGLATYREPDDTSGADWWSPLWQVVRTCRDHALLRDCDGEQAWRVVRSLVPPDAWLTADSRLGNIEDVGAAWASAHDKVRFLPGETMLDTALSHAEANPVVPPRDRGEGYGRFLALVAAVARRRRNEPAAIPVERWAALLGVRPNTVSVWRRWAQEDGILRLARPNRHAARRAAEYYVASDLLVPARGTL